MGVWGGETENSGEVREMGEWGGDVARDMEMSYVKACPGQSICCSSVMINNTAFHSQQDPRLDYQFHGHTTLRLVEVMGC